jgi:hypothetical protein
MISSKLERAEENPIEKMATSVYPPFALLAGMQLDLFSPLKDEPMSADQIAANLGVASGKLKPLLYALVVAGYLTVDSDVFSNTDAANRYLVKSSPFWVGDIHELLSTMWSAALKTAESIRTGSPQAKLDYSDMSQEDLRQFFRGEHPYAVECGQDLVKRYDFSAYSSLLDVGGGSGGLAIAVTEACPHIQATVVDLPKITPVTHIYIDEAGAGNLSPDDARSAIQNVSKVMNPGGEIYIRGYGIIDDSRTSPQKLVGFNLVFINVYDEGQAYTEQEHKDWLEEAGFGDFRRTILEDGSSIIMARKIN